MKATSKAYLVGGGIGSLAAAAFMIRDGSLPGGNISIFEAAPAMGGSLDGAGDPAGGYSLRGGRMLTTDNYECTWDLFKTIPSLNCEGKTVFDPSSTVAKTEPLIINGLQRRQNLLALHFRFFHSIHSFSRRVGGRATPAARHALCASPIT